MDEMWIVLGVTNLLCLWIGFALGDDAHHEAVDTVEEVSWDRHAQQALWVSRRTRA